jgi:hypothetical protein
VAAYYLDETKKPSTQLYSLEGKVFFDYNVFGTAQLPLSVEGGELRIRYERLPLIAPEWRIVFGIGYSNSFMIALKRMDGAILSDLATSHMKQHLICS